MATLAKKFTAYYRMFGLRGLSFAAQNKVLRTSREVAVVPPGVQHPVTLRLKTSDISTYEQVFENDEYDFSLNTPPRVIVDGGANIGLASIYFANRYPDAKIIAIEPEASNFSLLRRNVAAYPQITPVQAALWGKNTQLKLIDPGIGKWGFQTAENGSAHARTCHEVPALTIEHIMEEEGLGHIDILKLDIEGAEKEVFENATAWIDRIGVLIVELHDKLKPGSNRSFYNATNGFGLEWRQGENIYLARNEHLIGQRAPSVRRRDTSAAVCLQK